MNILTDYMYKTPAPDPVIVQVTNPFRDKTMRKEFDAAIFGFNTRHRNFIRDNGTRCYGNGCASAFWEGFDDQQPDKWADRASRQMIAYAYYRAGQLVRKAIQPLTRRNT